MSIVFQSVLIIFIFLNVPENTLQINMTLLKDIIYCGDKYHKFQNFPILTPRKMLYDIQDFIIDLQTTFQRPTYILTKKDEHFYFRFHIVRESLVLVFFRGISDNVLEMIDTYTRGRRLMSVLFILTRSPITYHEINEIMTHTWTNNYMHAILLYRDTRGQDHLVTFDPYSVLKMKSLLSAYRVTDIFALRANGNLHGYRIRSPVKFDLPRVFKATDLKGRKRIRGYGYQLFMAFVKYRNATFEEYVAPNTSNSAERKDVFHLISVGEIEISLHPSIMRDNEKVGSSYPIRLNDLCVMIPMANEIPSYMYLWRPLQFSAWIFLLCGTIYLTFILMWIPPHSGPSKRKEFGLSLLQSIGYMLNMPTWGHYYDITWKYFLVVGGTWVLGFLITTWYCALLESFLTSTVFGAQIDTMDDLIASGLKILVTNSDIEDSKKSTFLPDKFKQLLIGTTVDKLTEHRNAFNTSYAYVVAVDRWNFLSMQQQYSKRPIFRLSHICFLKHHLAYPMAYDSRFQYSLNFFLLYAQQSGLTEYWSRVDFKYAVREGYVKPIVDSNDFGPMHGEKMRLAWEVLAIGLSLSMVAFFMEVLLWLDWHKDLWVLLRTEYRRVMVYVGKVLREMQMYANNQ